METFLWVEKYRPKSISECILPEDLKNTFSEFVKDKHIPNLILCGSAGVGKGGRKLSYTAKVQGNGNLLVGKAYTAMLDLQVGDEFEIKLGKKAIRLIPVGAEEEFEE